MFTIDPHTRANLVYSLIGGKVDNKNRFYYRSGSLTHQRHRIKFILIRSAKFQIKNNHKPRKIVYLHDLKYSQFSPNSKWYRRAHLPGKNPPQFSTVCFSLKPCKAATFGGQKIWVSSSYPRQVEMWRFTSAANSLLGTLPYRL